MLLNLSSKDLRVQTSLESTITAVARLHSLEDTFMVGRTYTFANLYDSIPC